MKEINYDIYRDLQKHLDEQSFAFPPAKSGADIQLLKHFFNPEEARFAMLLSYKPQSFEEIYEICKDTWDTTLSFQEMTETFEKMIRNHLNGSFVGGTKTGREVMNNG